ncbi:MAG: DUF4340 domain-containing protein, partial [Pseudomonadota bacterium]
MTPRTLQLLGAVTAVLIVALIALEFGGRDDSGGAGDLLLPGFEAVANDVNEVRVTRADDETVTLRRNDGGGWTVAERDDYAADVGELRQLIVALAEATVVEEKTSNPDLYERLGVGDPDAGGKGTVLTLSGPDAEHTVILGDVAQSTHRYARVADQATSYLINTNPSVPASAADWLSGDLIDIGSDEIRRVEIAHADGETLVIEKTEQAQTDFDLVDVPQGRELSYPTVGNGVAGALDSLELDDVRSATETAPQTTTTFRTWDGLTVTAAIVADEDEHWVRLSASADDDVEAAADTGENGDAPTAADEAGPKPADTAARLNERTAGWEYRLPEFKTNTLQRRWDDM